MNGTDADRHGSMGVNREGRIERKAERHRQGVVDGERERERQRRAEMETQRQAEMDDAFVVSHETDL